MLQPANLHACLPASIHSNASWQFYTLLLPALRSHLVAVLQLLLLLLLLLLLCNCC
jgi:hypothetical protein